MIPGLRLMFPAPRYPVAAEQVHHPRMRSPLAGAPLLFVLLLLPACSKLPAGAECSVDTDCTGTGAVCLSNKCFQFVASCDACSEGACTDRCLAGVLRPPR